MPQPWIQYIFTGAIIALVFFRRFKRIGQTQRLRIETLWVVPEIFLALGIMLLVKNPPSGLGWLWVGLALGAGSSIGWYRARWIEIAVDPETGQLNQRSSPAALIFLAGLMAVRWALRSAVTFGDERWHLGAALISDIFIALAIGILATYRIEIYLRARRLLRPR